MAYEVVMSYHLHMPSYFLGTFTEYPKVNLFVFSKPFPHPLKRGKGLNQAPCL